MDIKISPVRVLAESNTSRTLRGEAGVGEARESTHGLESRQAVVIRAKSPDEPEKTDSRGGRKQFERRQQCRERSNTERGAKKSGMGTDQEHQFVARSKLILNASLIFWS